MSYSNKWQEILWLVMWNHLVFVSRTIEELCGGFQDGSLSTICNLSRVCRPVNLLFLENLPHWYRTLDVLGEEYKGKDRKKNKSHQQGSISSTKISQASPSSSLITINTPILSTGKMGNLTGHFSPSIDTLPRNHLGS